MSSKKPNIKIEKIIEHWIESSEHDFSTMIKLFESKSYAWALFLGHISTEKLLKALYVKRNKTHAPFIHNLYRLAELSELEMNAEQSDWLDFITTFNLNARYDDYKKEFHSLCTKDFTGEWIEKIKIIREWIKKML